MLFRLLSHLFLCRVHEAGLTVIRRQFVARHAVNLVLHLEHLEVGFAFGLPIHSGFIRFEDFIVSDRVVFLMEGVNILNDTVLVRMFLLQFLHFLDLLIVNLRTVIALHFFGVLHAPLDTLAFLRTLAFGLVLDGFEVITGLVHIHRLVCDVFF